MPLKTTQKITNPNVNVGGEDVQMGRKGSLVIMMMTMTMIKIVIRKILIIVMVMVMMLETLPCRGLFRGNYGKRQTIAPTNDLYNTAHL